MAVEEVATIGEAVAYMIDYKYDLISDCRVPKLFRQEVSPKRMVKLTDRKIKWAVNQVINKGESTAVVAAIYCVSRRRIQQLAKGYKETGE
ncbi:MAG: hypothetical protein JW878_06465 [Methanomicrobia archaeon]|nr:hypothetical protein [Methanomicrobia archaeon]